MSLAGGSLLQEWKEGKWCKVSIHVPIVLTNRSEITKLVTSNGGMVQSNINAAKVVLIEECHEDDIEARYSGIKKSLHRDSRVVDKKWLIDSISMGVMQDWNKYQPRFIDKIAKQSSSIDAPTTKQPINARSTTERSIRNAFTKTDESLIEQFMAIAPSMKTSQIATALSRLCTTHSQASILTHLQNNIGRGKEYDVKARRFQREQGPERLEEIRSEIMEGIPDLEWSLQITHSPLDRTRASEGRDEREGSESSTSLLFREGTGPASSDADTRQKEMKTENGRWNDSNFRDAWTETDSSLESAILTESEKEEASSREFSHQAIQAVSVSRRKFTREHVDRLVEKLAIWFKSIFEAMPSSQDSVVGVLKSSQEFPRPPFQIFIEMAQEISTHTAEEWLAHFERQDNQRRYLDLGKELFEKMLTEEAEQTRQNVEIELESRLPIRRRGATSEEVEIEMSTQEDREPEIEIEKQDEKVHRGVEVISKEEFDELERSDEESEITSVEQKRHDEVANSSRPHSDLESQSYDNNEPLASIAKSRESMSVEVDNNDSDELLSDEPLAGLIIKRSNQLKHSIEKHQQKRGKTGMPTQGGTTGQSKSTSSVQKSTSIGQRRKVVFSIDLDDSVKSPFNVVGNIRKKSLQEVDARKRQRVVSSQSSLSPDAHKRPIKGKTPAAENVKQKRETGVGSAMIAQSSRASLTDDKSYDEECLSDAVMARLQTLANRHKKPLLCLQYLYQIVGEDLTETEFLASLSP